MSIQEQKKILTNLLTGATEDELTAGNLPIVFNEQDEERIKRVLASIELKLDYWRELDKQNPELMRIAVGEINDSYIIREQNYTTQKQAIRELKKAQLVLHTQLSHQLSQRDWDNDPETFENRPWMASNYDVDAEIAKLRKKIELTQALRFDILMDDWMSNRNQDARNELEAGLGNFEY